MTFFNQYRNTIISQTSYFNIKSHPFHLVPSSIWPILIPTAMFGAVFSFVSWLNPSDNVTSSFGAGIVFVSALCIMLLIFNWVYDILEEGRDTRIYTDAVEDNYLLGVVIFIWSEIMLFMGVFWAFFQSSLAPSIFLGNVWPPVGIEPMNPFGLPLINTVLLLLSGVTLNYSYYTFKGIFAPDLFSTARGTYISHEDKLVYPQLILSLIATNQKGLRSFFKRNVSRYRKAKSTKRRIKLWKRIQRAILFYFSRKYKVVVRQLILTILLGTIFMGIQGYEYISSAFTISDSVFGSTFFVATGLHGLHVALGLVLLTIVLVRFKLGDFSLYELNPHIGFTVAALYWHFVDVVWLFLYLFVYLWSA